MVTRERASREGVIQKRAQMKLLVTGGTGFIGSAFVRMVLGETDWSVTNLDKLTYAGLSRLPTPIWTIASTPADAEAAAALFQSSMPRKPPHPEPGLLAA